MSQRRVGKICNIQRASRSARFRAVFEHTRPASLHICPDQKFFPTSLCGVLVFGSVSRRPPVRPPARPPARPPSTHNLLTHNLSTHTTCSHTTCPHTTYSHTTCSHTTCLVLTQLVITQLAHSHTSCPHTTYNLLTHNLSTHNLLTHNLSSHNLAGVALGDIHLHFAWQAWHLATSTFTLRGRRGTYGTGPALVAHRVAAAL